MKYYFLKFVLLIAGAFSVVTGAQAEQTRETKETMKALKVELLVFSGRPNPTFLITDKQQIKDIMGLAKSLPKNKALKDGESGLPEPKLGYQGFVVTNQSAIAPEIKSFVVNGSAVQLALMPTGSAKGASKAGVEQSAAIDSSTSLESKLLSHVKNEGIVDDKLLEFIDQSK